MGNNQFVRQEATSAILANVTGVCNHCYAVIEESSVIFYDMHNCRYLCSVCKESHEERKLSEGGESCEASHSLFT